jgi:hypothetical protein
VRSSPKRADYAGRRHFGDSSLALGIVIVDFAMVLLMVPTAFVARRGFQQKTRCCGY